MEESKSLFKFHLKREVAENFSLEELLDFARQRNLQEWFAENFYSGEARKIAAALKDEASDSELKLLVCKLFDLSPENLSNDELKEISAVVERNQCRELFMKKSPGDDRKAAFVETQGELVRAIKDDAKLIYLYGGEFRIPLNKRGVAYVGCENAVVDIDAECDVNLDACEIVLENLQVYLHNPIKFTATRSKNIKLLDGSRKTLATNVTLQEIFHILRGRRAFESPFNFKRRAEDIQGASVGVVLLDDKDFDFSIPKFNFRPRWDFEYIAVLKDFATGKNFSVKLQPKDAEALYINERKLQIFADFTYRLGKLTILKLYFDTKTLGRIEIEVALREEEFVAGSSCPFGLGYGLEIITAYEKHTTSKEKSAEPKNSIRKIISDLFIGVTK